MPVNPACFLDGKEVFHRNLFNQTAGDMQWFLNIGDVQLSEKSLTGSSHMPLALVLVLDQIPRSLFRDTNQCFDCDPLACIVSVATLSAGTQGLPS